MLSIPWGAIRQSLIGAAVVSVLVPFTMKASDLTFTTINNPADNSLQTPTFNQLLGINDAGVIAGYYGDGAIVNNHGFVYQNGTFTPENVAGTDQTQVVAINNTLSGGSYETAGFSVINSTGLNQGFTKVGNTFTNVNGPGSTFTQILGLNDHGQAVGFYTPASGGTLGFQYTLGGSVTTLGTPIQWNASSVTAAGINNAGTIVGFYTNSIGTFGFIDQSGNFTTPTDPLGTNPMFFGVNNVGQIVGTDTSNVTGAPEGFVYDWQTGTWTSIIDPNEDTTAVGTFGVSGTTLNGINDEGQVVGFYEDSKGDVDGVLVNTTPEPASLSLVGLTAVIGFLVWLRRRKVSMAR